MRNKKGQFLKGFLPWNKGKHHSKETCLKISKANKGFKMAEETKRKIGLSLIGKNIGKKHPHSIDWKNKMSKIMTGRIMSQETKTKMSLSHKGMKKPWAKFSLKHKKGKENPRWIKDRTKLQKYGETNKDRRSSIYREWRLGVYKRDGWKCRINNQDCSGLIIAHHILSYTHFPKLRYEINNGITLCHFHHPRKREEESKLSPYFQSLVAKNF